jgi:hypothetical protein
MSHTTAVVRASSRYATAGAVREREARARAAARRRIHAANQAIERHEIAFEAQLERLDAASRRLPDLVLRAPTLPTLRSDAAADPAAVERHQADLARIVQRFSERLTTAVAEAECQLQRRVRKAAAWRRAADLERQAEMRETAARATAQGIGAALQHRGLPARPDSEAELEQVEAFVAALEQSLDALEREAARLEAQSQARDRAAMLGGQRVGARGAAEAHGLHAAEKLEAAKTLLRATIASSLASAGLREGDLPEAVRRLIAEAMDGAVTADRRAQVERWILREGERRRGVERALAMMQAPPELVHEEPGLSRRWTGLVARLQRVASELDDFSPSLEKEYEQLQRDVQRYRDTAFTKADWIRTMTEQGFEVLEHEDGDGLVLVDLDNPEVWLEATPLESEEGGFAAVLELRTDAALSAERDAAVTSSVCDRLAQLEQHTGPDVQGETRVIERAERIERSRRPVRRLKTMAADL